MKDCSAPALSRRRYTPNPTTADDEVQILREPEGITVSLHPGEGECRCGCTLIVGTDVDLAPLGGGRYRVTRCATGEVLGEVTDVPELAPWEAHAAPVPFRYEPPAEGARELADDILGYVDSEDAPDNTRADALALAFVDVAERVFPGGLHSGATTGVDFEREGVAVRVVAMEVPVAHRDINPENAVLSYGSDNAGGVHLCLGDARIHLSGDAVHDLAAGLLAEASRPPSSTKEAG